MIIYDKNILQCATILQVNS